MRSHVLATAGHVDHGKSTLVRALTGMEPDRLVEERRRGLTIDLGFAWTVLPSGSNVAFVDVPGHERFLSNMLAGVAPVNTVCFVVAADAGWSAQSSEHRDAIAALGIQHGLIVLTRADRAPSKIRELERRARAEFRDTGLSEAPIVAASAVKGDGIEDVRRTLEDVVANCSTPRPDDRVRLWLDRSFSVKGAGTVATGTLTAGSVSRGDRLELVSRKDPLTATVREVQTRGAPTDRVEPTSRAGINLRAVAADSVHRGDALISPDAWPITRTVDVRGVGGKSLAEMPTEVVVYVGTASVPGRLRLFDRNHGRLSLAWRLPLIVGDRLLLRGGDRHHVLGGSEVLDPEPPRLSRRGEGRLRGEVLAGVSVGGGLIERIAREGAIDESRLRKLGLLNGTGAAPTCIRIIDGWWVHQSAYAAWQEEVRAKLKELAAYADLADGVTVRSLRAALSAPAAQFLDSLLHDCGLVEWKGVVMPPGGVPATRELDVGVAALEARLRDNPFDSPNAGEIAALGLGIDTLASAERQNRLMRLEHSVVLLPSAPQLAFSALERLDQPFTTSEARQALRTSRRVAIALLEYLDRRGRTRRIDANHREVIR